MKNIDKKAFEKLLKENKEAALEMIKDDKGIYLQEVQIGKQKYKIFPTMLEALFGEKASKLLPEGYAAFILSDFDYKKKEISRSDFKNWYFIGNANFQGEKFTGIADFSGAVVTGLADFRGAKFTKYADFEGANFNQYKDSLKC